MPEGVPVFSFPTKEKGTCGMTGEVINPKEEAATEALPIAACAWCARVDGAIGWVLEEGVCKQSR